MKRRLGVVNADIGDFVGFGFGHNRHFTTEVMSKDDAMPIFVRTTKDASIEVVANLFRLLQVDRKRQIAQGVIDSFNRLLARFVLDGIKIECVDLSASRAGMMCRISIGKDHIELLSALAAGKRVLDGEIPIHDDSP